tara:strand:- start:438 stop:557 length:120 start_codon:yes stop_codon:yes gene_type:complete
MGEANIRRELGKPPKFLKQKKVSREERLFFCHLGLIKIK